MNCALFRECLYDWTENNDSRYSREEFEAHALACEECASIRDEFVKTLRMIDIDKTQEPLPYAEARMLARIENTRSPRWYMGFPVIKPEFRPVYLVVGLVIAIITGVIAGYTGSEVRAAKMANHQDMESIRSALNIPEDAGDDIVFFSNP